MQPDFAPSTGWELLAVLAVASTAVVALAAVAARFVPSAVWQRTAWQACVLGLLALVAVELSGTRAGLVQACRGPVPPAAAPSAATLDVSASVAPPLTVAPPVPEFVAIDEDWPDAVDSGGTGLLALPMEEAHEVGGMVVASARQASDSGDSPSLPAASLRPLPGMERAGVSVAGTVREHDLPPRMEGKGLAFRWPLLIWAAGAVVVLGRVLCSRVALFCFRRRLTELHDEALLAIVRRLAQRMGIRRTVRVLTTERLGVPLVFGGLRPTIVLPARFARDFNSRQQEAMLAHELAHVAAGDPLWHAVAILPCALLWWQPLAWWSRCRLRAASEAVADEASALVPDGPRVLAASLVLLGRRLVRARPAAGLSVEGSGFRSGLGRRVERLLKLPARSWRAPRGPRLALARLTLPVVLALVAISCTAWAPAQVPYPEGGTTMSVLKSSWRTSLAAAALWALLGPASGDATAQEKPAAPDKPAAEVKPPAPPVVPAAAREGEGEKKRPEAREEKRDRPRGEAREGERPERPRAEGREGEHRERDAGAREHEAKRRHLEEAIRDVQNKIRETKEGTDDRKELEGKLQTLMGHLRELVSPDRGPREGGDRERMAQRLEEIKRKVRELQEAGKQDEAERVKREGEEIMRAMQGRGREGGPPGGPDRERMMQRLEEIKRKVHELQEAGKQDEAERVKREGEEIMRALQGRGREGGPPGGPDRERMVQRIEELKRKIRELQEAGKEDEVEKLKREGQELMRAMQGRGPEGGPREGRPHEGQHHEGPGDVAARVHRLQAAAENLRAAGFGREADHVMQLVEQLTSGRAPREGEPRGEGPRREGMGPGVQELRGEVQQMRREMQELREHLKQLLERNQPHGERK